MGFFAHSELRVSAAGGPLAAGVLLLAGVALAHPGITAWMHNLLSYSAKHPVPQGLQSDYGVVLGYALHKNGSCTHPLQSRVEVGVALFKQAAVRRLVFSGAHPGSGPRHVSEANAMADYAATLVDTPPPPGRWLLEEASTSTRTNAVFSLRLIAQQQQAQQQGEQQEAGLAGSGAAAAARQQQQVQEQAGPPITLVLVTNPFHQWRSYWVFRRAALQAGLPVKLYVAAAPFAPHCGYGNRLLDAAADQLDFWRELAAIVWYAARGWL